MASFDSRCMEIVVLRDLSHKMLKTKQLYRVAKLIKRFLMQLTNGVEKTEKFCISSCYRIGEGTKATLSFPLQSRTV